MAVNSRQQLIDYALRRLGHPVIQINVDDQQLEDRVNDALDYFQDFNTEAVERVFIKHQITSTDIANEYITLDDSVTTVSDVLAFGTYQDLSFFDVEYQYILNEFQTWGSLDLISYDIFRRHLNQIQHQLDAEARFQFSRITDKLTLQIDWGRELKEGQYLLIDAYKTLDPQTYTEIYDDRILKKYVTALVKKQWGANLSKFEGVQLPGGITLNGQQILDQAQQEIQDIEEEIRNTYEEPPRMYFG